MNESKRKLIIWAIVLNFVMASSILYMYITGLISLVKLDPSEFVTISKGYYIAGYTMSYAVEFLAMIASPILLLISIAGKGMHFQKRKKLYIVAIFINVFVNLVSIATILLAISYFKYLDIEVIKEEDVVEISEDDLKDKISKLRKLKEEGIISEEEFKDEIMKLL